ncbi:hypothetical protein TNCV_4509351 [Trichonephila clavipes]|nr:hypothetical protein TNCV_4509351 [Trichonephila clavipes]
MATGSYMTPIYSRSQTARESQEAEEKEWLEKQLAASVSLKLDCTDLSPQERNPDWLKSKAENPIARRCIISPLPGGVYVDF